MASPPLDDVYVAEDECLGFPIFYASLELLADALRRGDATPGGGADGLRLLQALHASLAAPDAGAVRAHQRAAGDRLIDLLAHGLPPPSRSLAAACLARLPTVGDSVGVHGCASALADLLAPGGAAAPLTARLAPNAPVESARAGLLAGLGALHGAHGAPLAARAADAAALAARHAAARGADAVVRVAALDAVASIVEGGPAGGARGSDIAAAAAARAALRALTDAPNHGPTVAAAARTVIAVARGGGAGALWSGGATLYDAVRKGLLAALDARAAAAGGGAAATAPSPLTSVAAVHASADARLGAALGALAASASSPAAAAAEGDATAKPRAARGDRGRAQRCRACVRRNPICRVRRGRPARRDGGPGRRMGSPDVCCCRFGRRRRVCGRRCGHRARDRGRSGGRRSRARRAARRCGRRRRRGRPLPHRH